MEGKIYKLVNNKTDLVYYGSTCRTLHASLKGHKNGYNSWEKNNGVYMTSYELFENDAEVEIILVEEVIYNKTAELVARERYYIENNKCVNKLLKVPVKEKKKVVEYDKNEVLRKYYEEKEKKKQYYQRKKLKCKEIQEPKFQLKQKQQKVNEDQKNIEEKEKIQKSKEKEKSKIKEKEEQRKIKELDKLQKKQQKEEFLREFQEQKEKHKSSIDTIYNKLLIKRQELKELKQKKNNK